MEKRNVLVLENIDHLDDNFSAYLNKYHDKNDVNIIYGLAFHDEDPIDLIPHLSKADTLAVCSTFGDTKQFETIVNALCGFTNIKRIEILYLFTDNDQKFVSFLYDLKTENLDLYTKIKQLVSTREVCEIYHTSYETKGSYFNTYEYTFDVVQLYIQETNDLIFPIRQPISYWHNWYLFKDQVQVLADKTEYVFDTFKEYSQSLKVNKNLLSENIKLKNDVSKLKTSNTKKQNTKEIEINKKDISELKDLFYEVIATLEHRNESLEIDGRFFSDNEKNELTKQNTNWISLIQKIKDQI